MTSQQFWLITDNENGIRVRHPVLMVTKGKPPCPSWAASWLIQGGDFCSAIELKFHFAALVRRTFSNAKLKIEFINPATNAFQKIFYCVNKSQDIVTCALVGQEARRCG